VCDVRVCLYALFVCGFACVYSVCVWNVRAIFEKNQRVCVCYLCVKVVHVCACVYNDSVCSERSSGHPLSAETWDNWRARYLSAKNASMEIAEFKLEYML